MTSLTLLVQISIADISTIAALTEHLDDLVDSLRSGQGVSLVTVSHLLARLAKQFPKDVERATPALINLLSENDPDSGWPDSAVVDGAVRFLHAVSEHDPHSVLPAAPDLVQLCRIQTMPEPEIYNDLTIYRPDDLTDDFPLTGIHTGATGALAELARHHPSNVIEYHTTIIDMIDHNHEAVRRNTAKYIAGIGAYEPSVVSLHRCTIKTHIQNENYIPFYAIQALIHEGSTISSNVEDFSE